jgi:TRAP-type C4-dicarboxylate transport system permease small subunit
MKKQSNILALKAVVATCFAFIFIYSWRNAEPFTYDPYRARQINPTIVLGAAFLFFLVSLVFQIKKR